MCKAFSLRRAAFSKASRLGPGGVASARMRAALAIWVRRSVRDLVSMGINGSAYLGGSTGLSVTDRDRDGPVMDPLGACSTRIDTEFR